MLKISGTDGRQVDGTGVMGLGLGGTGAHGRGESKGGAGMTEAEFQALMLEFDSRMKVLRTVVEAGGEVVKREGEGKGEGDGTAERGEEDTGAKGEI
jgi:hypothetical protein